MKVTIVQRRLTHYRVPLFNKMKKELNEKGIQLELVYGTPASSEIQKKDNGSIDWGHQVKTKYFTIFGFRLSWIPFPNNLKNSNLIIITQENSIISNYKLLLQRSLNTKIAFWGHGANFQSRNPNSLSEKFKRLLNKYVDWWFAYTHISVDLVTKTNFPYENITNLENAVDVSALKKDILLAKNSLSSAGSGYNGIYIGSLYKEKRLEFLLKSAAKIKNRVPGFQLTVVGDGPDAALVEDFCIANPWCKYVGFQDNKGKAYYLAQSNVMLNPGLVGLGILDSFASGVPLITTDCKLHSPEVDYLAHDINGLIVQDSVSEYVDMVVTFFNDDTLRTRLVDGALTSSKHYTIENMSNNFVAGISKILNVN